MSAVNRHWLDRLIGEVQELSHSVITAEESEMPAIVNAFLDRIEPAPDPLHNALLATLMLDVCRHVFDSLHASLATAKCTCAAETWSVLAQFTRWYETDPRLAVRGWMATFVPVYRRNHPPSVSTRAAELMRHEPAHRWTVIGVARRLGVTRRHLSTDFRARFGMGPLDYLHLARVARAIRAIEEPLKIEAIAGDVGYRSKKDFYRAFRTWTGMTPAAARLLPADTRRTLEASLRARCLWGNCLERHALLVGQPLTAADGALDIRRRAG